MLILLINEVIYINNKQTILIFYLIKQIVLLNFFDFDN